MIERPLYAATVVILVLAIFWLLALAVTVTAYATVEMFEGLMSWARAEFG